VVLAVEKLVTSKLYEPGANQRIFTIDKHVGMVSYLIGFSKRKRVFTKRYLLCILPFRLYLA